MESSLDMLSEASRLGQGISCSIAQEDAHHGCSHTVYKIISENSIEWAARICHDSDNWQYEIRALKLLQYIKQQRPNLRTPNVFFRDDHPVLYSEWVRGEPLAIWNHGIPAIKRETLLDDFAEFVLQLWTIPAPPDLSSTQSSSYSVWLSQSLDRGLRRTLNGTARWGDPIDYLIMRSMIPEYTVGLDKYTAIGFSHGDLNTFNVMRDEDFHLTGVVDWDWMSTAPLPAIIHHPWFIADIPGWNNHGVTEGESFAEDRGFLETAVRKKEISQKLPLTVSTLLCDSGKRFFFQAAFHNKGIHHRFVVRHCERTEENIAAARAQLDVALHLYPELRGMNGVKQVKERLDIVRAA